MIQTHLLLQSQFWNQYTSLIRFGCWMYVRLKTIDVTYSCLDPIKYEREVLASDVGDATVAWPPKITVAKTGAGFSLVRN